jgi:hypothetical protein
MGMNDHTNGMNTAAQLLTQAMRTLHSSEIMSESNRAMARKLNVDQKNQIVR